MARFVLGFFVCVTWVVAGCTETPPADDGGELECVPACTDRECGDDGCEGQCPPGCADNEVCAEDVGVCEPLVVTISSLRAVPSSVMPGGSIALEVVASPSHEAELTVLWEVTDEWDGSGWTIAEPDQFETTVVAPAQGGASAQLQVTVTMVGTTVQAQGQLLVSTVDTRGPVLELVYADQPLVARGGEQQLFAEARHPHDLPLSYLWTLPEGWTLAEGADAAADTVRVVAPATANTTGLARVRVEDNLGQAASGGVHLATRPLSQPAISDITATPSPVAPGAVILVAVEAVDPDTNSADGLTYTWRATEGFRVAAEVGESLVTTTPQVEVVAPQTYNTFGMVQVSVDNGALQSRAAVVVATRANRPPVIHSVPTTTTVASGWDGPWSYQVVAVDPDGDVLSYELVGGDSSATISESGLVSWYPTCDDLGSQPLTVVVRDDQGATAQQLLTMQVDFRLVNHAQFLSAVKRRLPGFGAQAEDELPRVVGACERGTAASKEVDGRAMAPHGYCEELSWSACLAKGPDYRFNGPFSTCEQPYCVPFRRLGACCVGAAMGGHCEDVDDPRKCDELRGQFRGYGTSCKQIGICSGACCSPKGCSSAQNAADCQLVKGTFAGPGSSCGDDGICDGACCSETSCRLTTQQQCNDEESEDPGRFAGVGVPCEKEDGSSTCLGGCCTKASEEPFCVDLTTWECAASYPGGYYAGLGNLCSESPCK